MEKKSYIAQIVIAIFFTFIFLIMVALSGKTYYNDYYHIGGCNA